MYKIKWNFDLISNEKEAYIMGYLLADGYILDRPFYRLGMTLAMKDEAILKEIRDYISPEIPLKIDRGKIKLDVCRKEIVENLLKLGMQPNKTGKSIKIPKMKKELVRHFIRGYFDGDGALIQDREYMYFYICSPTPEILIEIADILKTEEIRTTTSHDKRKGKIARTPEGFTTLNFDQWRIYIMNRNNLEKIYEYMYKDCSIKLKRKFEKFDKWLKTKKVIRKRSKI